MTAMKVTTSAVVVLTVEVPVSSSYGADWKLDDMHAQIVRETTQAVEHELRAKWPRVKLIGRPKVRVCTHEVET